jgi:hypothetical protein
MIRTKNFEHKRKKANFSSKNPVKRGKVCPDQSIRGSARVPRISGTCSSLQLVPAVQPKTTISGPIKSLL